MGVRCVTQGSGRSCINGPARGLTVEKLKDPVTNIRVAVAILESKGWDLGKYAGEVTKSGYAGRVGAVERALRGEFVETESARARQLIGQIAPLARGRTS